VPAIQSPGATALMAVALAGICGRPGLFASAEFSSGHGGPRY
jgi:hypothetical protein